MSDRKVWDEPTVDQHGIKNLQVFGRGPRSQSLTCLAELAEQFEDNQAFEYASARERYRTAALPPEGETASSAGGI